MRHCLILYLLLINGSVLIHGKVGIGNYHNHFSCELSLNPDFTYEYTSRFDLLSSWSKGTWSMSNDTIYLSNSAIYDTFSYVDTLDCGIVEEKTEIILSSDSIPEHISQIEAIGSMLLSGGQNRFPSPQKLYCKRGRLFEVNEDGSLRRKRIKNFASNKRYKTNYFKV